MIERYAADFVIILKDRKPTGLFGRIFDTAPV